MHRGSLIAGIVGILTAFSVTAQQPASSPAFEVASIRANTSAETRSSSAVQPGGRYTATNVTLRQLVRSAYGVQHDSQLVGGPTWTNTERFDIVAKAEGSPSTDALRDQARLMLRTLLADRFTLMLHRETRELPIYALVVARADGKLGTQLHPSTVAACSARTRSGKDNGSAVIPCGGGFARPGHLAARAV